MERLPLAGVRVVSLAHQYPGPFATMLLADLGADVVVVERPDGGDPTRAFAGFHSALARGKRSVALDLKSTPGRDAFLRLLNGADALLEGFRPGTMDRLGLGAGALRASHPGLVYVSISGFGQTGPHRARSGHDLTYQAEAGMLYEHLPPAPPPPPPSLALGDLVAGLFAAQAVLAGLVVRGRDSTGAHVDVSMVDGLISLLAAHIVPVVNRTGPPGFPYEPGYGVFTTADGAYVALGVAHEDHFWRALCDATGLGEERDLTSRERFAAHGRLRRQLEEALATRTADEWEELLVAADVPFGRVRSLQEAARSSHASARGLLVSPPGGDGAAYVRQPLMVDGAAPGPTAGPPALGAHTVEVLTEAGLPPDDIAALLADGAARQADAG